MKVRASVKKIGPNNKSVWRRPKNRRHKAKLFIVTSKKDRSANDPRQKQRQG